MFGKRGLNHRYSREPIKGIFVKPFNTDMWMRGTSYGQIKKKADTCKPYAHYDFELNHETEQRIFHPQKWVIDLGFVLIPMPTIMNPFWFIFQAASYSLLTHAIFITIYPYTDTWMSWMMGAMNECERSDTNQWLKIGFVPYLFFFPILNVCETACACVSMDFSFSCDTKNKMETKLKCWNISY